MTANIEGKNLARIRELKGMTQKQLSDLTGIDKVYISMIENGKRGLSKEKRRVFAEALGVPIEDFYIGNDKEKPQHPEPLRALFAEVEKAFEGKETLEDQYAFVAKMLKSIRESKE